MCRASCPSLALCQKETAASDTGQEKRRTGCQDHLLQEPPLPPKGRSTLNARFKTVVLAKSQIQHPVPFSSTHSTPPLLGNQPP